MKNTHQARNRWSKNAIVAGSLSSLMALSAYAQTPAPAPAASERIADDVEHMAKFIVTGSNIPLAGEAPTVPVQLITPSVIASSGETNLLEIIRKSAPQFSGNGNIGSNNGNISSGSTNGGSTLSLRNTATLVLINGRRVGADPVAASGGAVFVDLNTIPVSAVDHIEILTDGASAVYGADAVGGVVNVILKSNFEGGEVGGRYGFTNNAGRYREKTAYGVFGGTLPGGAHATVSFEWNKTDPLYNYERPYSDPSYGTTNFAGVIQTGHFSESGSFVSDPGASYWFLDPSLPSPKAGATLAERGYTGPFTTGQILTKFNLARGVTQLLGTEKKIATLALNQKLGNVELFGEALFARTDTYSQLNAQPIAVRLAADDPTNILGQDISVRNRFVDKPRTYTALSDSLHIVLGARGQINTDWTWEAAVNYNDNKQEFANGNLVKSAARAAAAASGKINLFAYQQAPGATDGLFGTARGDFDSTLLGFDAKVVGTNLITLPGGGVSAAFGVEQRKEELTADSDVDSQSATFAYDSGTTIDPFSESYHVESVYGEVRVPLVGEKNRLPGIYQATLTAAVRHERISNSSNPTVPKIAVSYQPFDDSFQMRATYSKSFAAPTLFDINAPTSIGFTNPLGQFDGNQANQESTPVVGLSPSTSRNYSAGFVWTPKSVKGLSITVDYFNIKQDDLISSLGADGVVQQVFADVEEKGAASQFAQYVHVGDFDGPAISTPGQISALGLDNIYFRIPSSSNIGTQKLSGLDFNLRYETDIPDAGTLALDFAGTYYLNYDIQAVAGAPFTGTAGRVTNLNGTIARYRTYSSLSYKVKKLEFVLAHTWYPATKDDTWTEDYLPDYNQVVSSYGTFDASVSYTFVGSKSWLKRAKVTVGVNNMNNVMPPRSATFDGLSNADIGEYNPVGQFFYTTMAFKF